MKSQLFEVRADDTFSLDRQCSTVKTIQLFVTGSISLLQLYAVSKHIQCNLVNTVLLDLQTVSLLTRNEFNLNCLDLHLSNSLYSKRQLQVNLEDNNKTFANSKSLMLQIDEFELIVFAELTFSKSTDGR